MYSIAGIVFVKSIDASKHRWTERYIYIYSLMDKVVESVGEENIVEIVTANDTNFKVAGRILMEKRD